MSDERSSIRVMIVDDHPTMRWGLERLIDSQAPHMQVVASAASVDQALSEAPQHRPELVLLDLNLGERSGLELIAPLTAGGAKVLVLTGEHQPELPSQAVKLGARGMLRKDAQPDTVLQAVRKVHEGELWLDSQTLSQLLEQLKNPQAAPRLTPEQHKQASLTLRERKIAHAVMHGRGASNKALAGRLFISEHTLRNHLSSIYHKLGVGNRLELYVYGLEHQLGATDAAGDALSD